MCAMMQSRSLEEEEAEEKEEKEEKSCCRMSSSVPLSAIVWSVAAARATTVPITAPGYHLQKQQNQKQN